MWKCYGEHERPKFTLKTGTILEDSPISLDKWLTAVWLIVNCKNGISMRDRSRSGDIAEIRLVHGAPYPVGTAFWII